MRPTSRRRAVAALPSRAPILALALALALALSVCSEPAPPDVVRAGPVGYAEAELGALSLQQRERLAALAGFGVVVSQEGEAELVRPMVERDVRALRLRRLMDEAALTQSGMSEAQIRAAYLRRPEYELRVRHLVILSERWRDDAHRERARRRAQEAARRAYAGEDFAEVAAELSEEPGAAERGGLLEPGRQETWVPEFWQAASRLREGQVSGVVETRYGYHVLKLEERRVVPLEEVRARVAGRLIPGPRARIQAEAWAEGLAGEIRLDTAELRLWDGEGGSTERVLASWTGGQLDSRAFDLHLAALGEEETDGAPPARRQRWLQERLEASALEERLIQEADRAGLELEDEEVRELWQKWRGRAASWASSLGFEAGQSDDDVKRAALQALVSDRQSATLARSGVLRHAAAVRRVVELEAAPPETAEDGAAEP